MDLPALTPYLTVFGVLIAVLGAWPVHKSFRRWLMLVLITAVLLMVAYLVHWRINCQRYALRIEPGIGAVFPWNEGKDLLIVIPGRIVNPRDTYASIVKWNISARLLDGEIVEAKLYFPKFPLALPLGPSGERVDLPGDKFWLQTKDPIPPHGISIGFVLGIVRGRKLDEPGTKLVVRCEDTDGVTFSLTVPIEDDVSAKETSPTRRASQQFLQSPTRDQ